LLFNIILNKFYLFLQNLEASFVKELEKRNFFCGEDDIKTANQPLEPSSDTQLEAVDIPHPSNVSQVYEV